MTERTPVEAANLDIYGSDVLPWSRPRDLMATSMPTADLPLFLGTTRPDGRPHSAGVGAVWHEGDLYFTSGPGARKARNLAANPACTISMRLEGLDLVLDGTAERVTDRAVIEAIVALYREGGWPAEPHEEGLTAPFSAPSAGPPPWHLHRFTIDAAVGVATAEPYGATRWRF
ncbi:pyridoxamine 5'-phosphate oxidase family protein [Spirillospora sp. CA-294931]|uniref:pyridoxamine 5'-phosphate oxidase family protein n=1 Tax=Spirillospora sp. CA-294931 TaxID=3240042 RepID=UPI003D8B1997